MDFYEMCTQCKDISEKKFKKAMCKHFDRLYNVTEYINEYNRLKTYLIDRPRYYMMVLDKINDTFKIGIDDVIDDDTSRYHKFLCIVYFKGIDFALNAIENGNEYYDIYVYSGLREFIGKKNHAKMLKRKNIQCRYFTSALCDMHTNIDEAEKCIKAGFKPKKSDFEKIFNSHNFQYGDTINYTTIIHYLIDSNIPKNTYEKFMIKCAYNIGDTDLLNYLIDKGICNIIETIDIKIPDDTCELINKLIALGMTTHEIAIFMINLEVNKN